MAQKSPLVLVFEDLHWADPSSLEILKLLMALPEKSPLLIVLVSRPMEHIKEWLSKSHLSPNVWINLDLSPLSNQDSAQLVENLLKIENLRANTKALILTKSEGNPFYLEELLRSLIDTGMVILEGDKVKAAQNIDQLEVPNSLQAIVASRIDRLPWRGKNTLQIASVIGRIFQEIVLNQILNEQSLQTEMSKILEELQKRELIRWKEDMEYIFKHAITHEVAYNSLLIAKRKNLHQTVAGIIETVFSDQLEELSPILSFHFLIAEKEEKAMQYLMMAAARAEGNYANIEALSFYQKAIKLIENKDGSTGKSDHKDQLLALYEKAGSIYSLLGSSKEAIETLDKAEALLEQKDKLSRARIVRKKGLAFNASRQMIQMFEKYKLAESILGRLPAIQDQNWVVEWLNLQLDLAWAHYFSAHVEELQKIIEKVKEIIEISGTLIQRNRFYETLFLADLRQYRYFNLPDSTIERLMLQLDTAKALGNRQRIGRAKVLLGFAYLWRNELELSQDWFFQGMDDAENVGDMDSLIIAKCYISINFRKIGDFDKTIFLVKSPWIWR